MLTESCTCRIAKWLLLPLLLLVQLLSFAQTGLIQGSVRDGKNKPLGGVNVVIDGTYTGTSTNASGDFVFNNVPADRPVTLVVSFLGFQTQKVTYTPGRALQVSMDETSTMMDEVIVSASRVEERIMETPVTVESVSARELQMAPSSELLSSLSRFKGIDVNQSSLLISSLSTRGFNSAKSERVIQMVDNVDYMSPSLSLYAGNISGVSDIDIETVDIIHGANSALYGANAFNGVVNTITKDPFRYEGVTVSVRGGNRNLIDLNARIAYKITPKLAIKVTGTYFEALDFVGQNYNPRAISIEPNNNPANSPLGYDAQHRYGDIGVDLGAATIPATLRTALRTAGFPTTSAAATAPFRRIFLPGFSEHDLAGSGFKAQTVRVNPSIHYLITDKIKASYEARLGYGSGIYQSSNRYLWNRVEGNLHKLEVKSDRWFLRAYRNGDAPGDTYDLSFWGTGMVAEQRYQAGASPGAVERAVATQLGPNATYASVYAISYAQAFLGARGAGLPVDQALAAAQTATASVVPRDAADTRFAPLREAVRTNKAGLFDPTFNNRSHFWDYSGQYQLPTDWANVIVGGSYRQFTLTSNGTLFSDADKTPVAEGAQRSFINNYEMGAYAQIQKSVLGERLKLSAAGRVDNFKNFGTRFSPRVSGVLTLGSNRQHNFRANYAQPCRAPAQVDQYIFLDIGQLLLLGNVSAGFQALPLDIGTRLAQNPGSTPAQFQFQINPLKPERMNTWEVGYKGMVTKGLYVDLNYYHSVYKDFIGTQRFIGREDGTAPSLAELVAPPAAGSAGFRNRSRAMQVWRNAEKDVTTQGFQAAVDWYITKGFNVSTNYTWSKLNGQNSREPINSVQSGLILGFNTPEHKVNFGINGEPVKNFTYSANLRTVSSYNYFMPFDEGLIEGFSMLDAQIGYRIQKINTLFRIGGTNLTDARAIQVFGAAPIGRIVYVGATFDANPFRR